MIKLITLFILLLLLFLLVLIYPKEVVSTDETRKPQTKLETIEAHIPIVITAKITASPYVPPPPKLYARVKLGPSAIKFLGNCESGNNPTTNTGNGYYGAFQFTIGTWNAMATGYTRADLAPYNVQVAAVHKLLNQASIFSQFPSCAIKMKNMGLI